MWTDEQRRRYHELSQRGQANELRAEEAAELATLVEELSDNLRGLPLRLPVEGKWAEHQEQSENQRVCVVAEH